MKKLGKTISIHVHKGEYWRENENIIMKKNMLEYCNPEALKMIKITNINVDQPN